MDGLTLDWILEHSLAHVDLPSSVVQDVKTLVCLCPDTRTYSVLQLSVRQQNLVCDGNKLETASVDDLAQAYLDFGRIAGFHGVLFALDSQLNQRATRLGQIIQDGLWRLCLIKSLEQQFKHEIFDEFVDQQLIHEYFAHPQQSVELLVRVSVSGAQLASWGELYLDTVANACVARVGSTVVSRVCDRVF